MGRAGPLGCVFNSDGANVALSINVKNGVLVEIARLGNRSFPKLYEHGVGVSKVANFHGANLRSKNALWTVCPSANRITRRYRFSISGTHTQRRIRPSAW